MSSLDYEKISRDKDFIALQHHRNQFIFPITVFFVLATLLFPILTGYTDILNKEAFWNISWAWIYALALFIMVWTLVTLYMSRAKTFDQESERIVERYKGGAQS
ncbi:DUF485 domain-containing protein [Macrococcus carouselicus]|uniref:DUF485 domain-containing protein n=1 Tax=Macrococcus carouselicus TaxID=69969 RepID=A0A9Q8CF31_9STAP|nr:DUF485 domain-containing protein [Macrococcus carouselicus]TDM02230.1 DUF485 domain-containing protein [Macrococcus carouselicus]